ncbi:MAG: hypothetical protein ACD_2C00143G0001 [uncultured bacterium (gcode 4)]|uniref:Uncharacterized protein n=1 Tax=uncultured bacterium (gcode 4) TaxID=1234023 RepID=K2G2Y9_9BACT|nr:MAG: hypothetical protein ACD_2C00143G0001 [uncultured bacterium (gcode 4)]
MHPSSPTPLPQGILSGSAIHLIPIGEEGCHFKCNEKPFNDSLNMTINFILKWISHSLSLFRNDNAFYHLCLSGNERGWARKYIINDYHSPYHVSKPNRNM